MVRRGAMIQYTILTNVPRLKVLFILGAVVGNKMNYTISMAGLNDGFSLSYTGKTKQSTTTLSGVSLQTLPTGKEVTVWHSANTCSIYSTCNTMFYYSWGAFSYSGIMRHLVAYSATKLIHQPEAQQLNSIKM